MEQRLHLWLQIGPHDRLGNSVRHRRHAECSRTSCFLRYLDRSNRWREVRPRGHAIPNPIEVPFQVLLELGDRLPVDTRSSLVGLDLLVGLEDDPFGDVKRLCHFWLRRDHRLLSQTHD